MAIYSGFSDEKWWFSIVMLVYQRVRHFEPKWWHGSSGSTILRNHQIWNVMKHPCDEGLPFTFCLILGRIDKETNVFEPSTSRCPVENRKSRKWVRVSLCHKLEPFPSHKQRVLQKLDPNFVHCQRSNIFPTSLQDLHCLSWTNITLCLCRSVCDHFYFSILMLSFFGALAQLQQAIIRDRCRLHNLIIRQVGPMLSQQRCQLHQTRWIATRFHEGHILTVESETEAQRTAPCISHHTHWPTPCETRSKDAESFWATASRSILPPEFRKQPVFVNGVNGDSWPIHMVWTFQPEIRYIMVH